MTVCIKTIHIKVLKMRNHKHTHTHKCTHVWPCSMLAVVVIFLYTKMCSLENSNLNFLLMLQVEEKSE